MFALWAFIVLGTRLSLQICSPTYFYIADNLYSGNSGQCIRQHFKIQLRANTGHVMFYFRNKLLIVKGKPTNLTVTVKGDQFELKTNHHQHKWSVYLR